MVSGTAHQLAGTLPSHRCGMCGAARPTDRRNYNKHGSHREQEQSYLSMHCVPHLTTLHTLYRISDWHENKSNLFLCWHRIYSCIFDAADYLWGYAPAITLHTLVIHTGPSMQWVTAAWRLIGRRCKVNRQAARRTFAWLTDRPTFYCWYRKSMEKISHRKQLEAY